MVRECLKEERDGGRTVSKGKERGGRGRLKKNRGDVDEYYTR